jgi:hypothetical protein
MAGAATSTFDAPGLANALRSLVSLNPSMGQVEKVSGYSFSQAGQKSMLNFGAELDFISANK